MDGNWERLTEAVSSAVNARSSELWLAAEVEEPHSTCPVSTQQTGHQPSRRDRLLAHARTPYRVYLAKPAQRLAATARAHELRVPRRRPPQRLNARCGSLDHHQALER